MNKHFGLQWVVSEGGPYWAEHDLEVGDQWVEIQHGPAPEFATRSALTTGSGGGGFWLKSNVGGVEVLHGYIGEFNSPTRECSQGDTVTWSLCLVEDPEPPEPPDYPDADYTDKIVVEVGSIRGYPISYSNIPNTQQYGPFYIGGLFQAGAVVSLDGRPLRWGTYVLKSADGTIVLAETVVSSFQTRAPFKFLPPQFCANVYTTFVLAFAEDLNAPEPPHPPGSGGDPDPYLPEDPPNNPTKPSAPAAGSCTCHDQLVYIAECILYHADVVEDQLREINRKLEYPAPSRTTRKISVAEGICHNLQGVGWLR